MSKGCDAKTELEMCLVKLCSPKLNYSNEAIANRIDKLEREINLLKAELKTEFKENQLNVKEKESLSEKSTSKEMLAEKQMKF